MSSSAARLVMRACALALLCALGGAGLEMARFGTSGRSASMRLERDVRARVDEPARRVRTIAERVASETGSVVAAAAANPDEKSGLFDRLTRLAHETSPGTIALTVYIPTGPANQYGVLAWSDGPAENIVADRLAGGAALFLARGTLGLGLVYVQPIESAGRRVGVVAAETLLSPALGVGPTSDTYFLETSFGPVTAVITFAGASPAASQSSQFTITMPAGGPVLDVHYAADDLHAARMLLRRKTAAVAALPLLGVLLLLTGRVTKRRAASTDTRDFVKWSVVAAAMLIAAAAASIELVRIVGAPPTAAHALEGLAALGLVALLPASWWWRRPHRLRTGGAPARFGVEQLLAGAAAAALLGVAARLLHSRITAPTLRQWQLPLFPLEWNGPLFLAGLLLAEVALYWALAMLLALMAGRWRLSTRQPRAAMAACVLWLGPTIVMALVPLPGPPLPRLALLFAGTTAVVFALFATALRRRYRQTTQAMRLVLLFSALFAPIALLYPVAWFYADGVARAEIEQKYAPDTISRPKGVRDELIRALAEIDRIPLAQLSQLVSKPAPADAAIPTQLAFDVWSKTSLSRTRTTSSIELYAPDRRLVSRFALNVPQYGGVTEANSQSQAITCTWDTFGEPVQFGAEERDMLHAEREICDPSGKPLGSIIVHVINDYQALPFVSSANPYNDLLRSPDVAPQGSLIVDLQVVVYGWSFSPLFTSGNVAWPITPDLFKRLYQSRTPFWMRLPVEDRLYNVYFANDQRFIYALGYPTTTIFQHLTRLAEMATLMAVVFVLLLAGAAVYAPIAQRGGPLAALYGEIRTSYYRKLFLYFVLAAIAPVLLFALAFGAYMTDKFRADVENEAASVATVARRVLEQTVGLERQPGHMGTILNDDVMVWIGQVLHQDVNLFEGPNLISTSQRDLFDSGLLPSRTPAAVYRAIALDRLPTAVAEDNLGTFQYLVAAAPVPAAGREAVLSVPLALRQREIEREIDELNRGVLVGAVFVILFAAGLGASVAGRVSDPVARLSRATRQIAAGKLDVRLVADTADELSRLIADFNSMAATLSAQRAELARTNQLKAWAEMARQVAHEIKNPLTPIQLAAEHLQHVHDDQGRPLGAVFEQCLTTILGQVRLLRRIAGEFSNYAAEPTPRMSAVPPAALVDEIIAPYRAAGSSRPHIENALPESLPPMRVDRTLIARALTNLVENALQAMPTGGTLRIAGDSDASSVRMTFTDTGVGMDEEAVRRAFDPYFSTKTAGSGLGLANAKRNIELCGGSIVITSAPGRGTVAAVTLPRAAAEPDASGAASTRGR